MTSSAATTWVAAGASKEARLSLRPGHGPGCRSSQLRARTGRCVWLLVRTSLGRLPSHRPRVGVERRAQRAHRVEESRSNGADRDAQGVRHGLLGKVKVVAQHDDGPMIDRQPSERALQFIAVRDRGAAVGLGCLVEGKDPEVGRPTPVLLRLRVARTDEDSVRPPLEARGSRSCGRSSQIDSSACCVASSARSASRRIR